MAATPGRRVSCAPTPNWTAQDLLLPNASSPAPCKGIKAGYEPPASPPQLCPARSAVNVNQTRQAGLLNERRLREKKMAATPREKMHWWGWGWGCGKKKVAATPRGLCVCWNAGTQAGMRRRACCAPVDDLHVRICRSAVRDCLTDSGRAARSRRPPEVDGRGWENPRGEGGETDAGPRHRQRTWQVARPRRDVEARAGHAMTQPSGTRERKTDGMGKEGLDPDATSYTRV